MANPSPIRKAVGIGAVVDVFAVLLGALCLVLFAYWLSDRVPASLPPYLQTAVASFWTWLTAGGMFAALVGAVLRRRVSTAYVFCLLAAIAALAFGMGWASNQLTLIQPQPSALQVSQEYLKLAAAFAAVPPYVAAKLPDPTQGDGPWAIVFRARSTIRWSLCHAAQSKGMDFTYRPGDPSSGPGLQNCVVWLVGHQYLADNPSLYDDICRVSNATYFAEWGPLDSTLPTNLQLVWVLTHIDAIEHKIDGINKPPLLPYDETLVKALRPCKYFD
jgi:hypothetical protein